MKELSVLSTKVQEQDMLKDIILQMNKDLALSNIGFEFNPDMEFESFWKDLVAVVRELLNKHYEKYLHFIYRVDINERDLLVSDIVPFEEVEAFVAFQIVKRLYKKVYFRRKFNGTS